MQRERVFRVLKNIVRQRRGYRRYFDDISVLMNEANFTDQNLQKGKGKQMMIENTCCLAMTIHLYLETQLEYLTKGFEIELLCNAELPEYFLYLSYVYEQVTNNRRQILIIMLGKLARLFN